MVHKERASMHCHGIACTISFDVDLISLEKQKLDCFKGTPNNISTSTTKIQ
jgi:hypothetical protein